MNATVPSDNTAQSSVAGSGLIADVKVKNPSAVCLIVLSVFGMRIEPSVSSFRELMSIATMNAESGSGGKYGTPAGGRTLGGAGCAKTRYTILPFASAAGHP